MFDQTRWRLVGWTMLLLSVILLVVGSLLYFVLAHDSVGAADRNLTRAGDTIAAGLRERAPDDLRLPEGYLGGLFVLLVDAEGRILSNPQQVRVAALPFPVAHDSSSFYETIAADDQPLRLYVRPLGVPETRAAAIIVGTRAVGGDGAQQRLLPTLVGGGAAVLLLFLAGICFLARRALAPIALAFRRQHGFVTAQATGLRTPLGSIKGYCTALLHFGPRIGADVRRQFLEEINHSTDRLVTLMDDLILHLNLQARPLPIHAESLDLDALANEVVAELSAQWPEHRIEYAAPRPLPPVWADKGRVHQVLRNLVGHAARCSPAGSMVRVAGTAGPEEVVVSVHDEGESIPPGQLEGVFEPWPQLDSNNRGPVRSSDLSLVICKGLITAQGGRIWVESAGHGHGTTFYFTLPIADGAETAAPPSPDGAAR